MNNTKNKRKVLKDLFESLTYIPKANTVLSINSYSYDNVDTLKSYFEDSDIYFSNFDERAIKIHQQRIDELKLNKFHTIFDDIRSSILKDNSFDLIINDFRLNFNTSDSQNVSAIKNVLRIAKPKSNIIISVVIDPRYESIKFGKDQEKAPTNKDKPWTFKAEENLTRFCFTVPYYNRLFKSLGLKIVKEFDIEKGKKWNPPYRRFLLTK